MSAPELDAALAGVDLRELAASLMRERDDLRAKLATAEAGRALEERLKGEALYQAELEAKRAEQAERERDEARAALIRAQEDHRAAVEGLETYEERIGDIADHVLGLVPPGVPSIVKLDAIERRCGDKRVAARRRRR